MSNRITGILKSYYPQVIDWFKEKDTIIFCDFVSKWPDLNTAKRARKSTLLSFFHRHNSRYPSVNEARIESIKSAFPLTEDAGVIEPNSLMATLLISQLKQLLEAIEIMDKKLRSVTKKIKITLFLIVFLVQVHS